ncbi:MAG: 50S ribosomal protein L29 [Deltaproteobacteria bacterium RBG_16_54_18]|nr:MAG: 50S ribosomal protein L29 [Deltaproteobacteria bacterium RBG_16_54_18]
MKARELREMSTDELRQKEKDLKEELFNLRFQRATGQLENLMRVGQVKRDIARVKTISREKAKGGT